MSAVPQPELPTRTPPQPPPLPRRMRLKLKRIYLDLTGPRLEREWRRAWSLCDRVDGWLMEGQERWLFEAAYYLPSAANIVEIGSFKGRSTCFLASGCRGTKKRVFAIDTFDGNDCDFGYRNFFGEFSKNLQSCGLSDYVEPLVGISAEVAKTWNKPIHLLFIDGSHRYEDISSDFEGFFPHVVPGGVIALHDVIEGWPGPLRAWHEIAKHRLVDVGYCQSLAYGRKPGNRTP
jgi:methyltransferase family protein